MSAASTIEGIALSSSSSVSSVSSTLSPVVSPSSSPFYNSSPSPPLSSRPPLTATATANTTAMFQTVHRDRAIRKLVQAICISVLPWPIVAWMMGYSWTVMVLSLFMMPAVVTIHGSISLIAFRIVSQKPPSPITPRHGVVVVVDDDDDSLPKQGTTTTSTTTTSTTTTSTTTRPEQQESEERKQRDKKDDVYHIPYATVTLQKNKAQVLQERTLAQPPLRLLVIGDSTSVGVGQSSWPTPVMPEIVAKTLSKKMNGRAVYWTCHGATGASVSWVIRELERGVQYLNNNTNNNNTTAAVAKSSSSSSSDHDNPIHKTNTTEAAATVADAAAFGGKIPASCSCETDESSTDESISGISRGSLGNDCGGVDGGEGEAHQVFTSHGLVENDSVVDIAAWQKSLNQHRERFEPDLQGFYDIVILTAGPNDAKSAFMPFLLTGEDSELRKQAQARGSSFHHDLHLVLETLARKMRLRVQLLRQSVQAVAESVLEKVEERLHLSSSFRNLSSSSRQAPNDDDENRRRPPPAPGSCEPWNLPTRNTSSSSSSSCRPHDTTTTTTTPKHPLVVFPGLPCHSLPIFQLLPVTWYGGAPIGLYTPMILEILDAHKQDLATALGPDVLFVPSPTRQETEDYLSCRGVYYQDRQCEDTLLSIRDMEEQDSLDQEQRLRQYYQTKGNSIYDGSPFQFFWSFFWGRPTILPECFRAFAADGLHLNELGYELWGRHLGTIIYQQWQQREQQEQHREHELEQSSSSSLYRKHESASASTTATTNGPVVGAAAAASDNSRHDQKKQL